MKRIILGNFEKLELPDCTHLNTLEMWAKLPAAGQGGMAVDEVRKSIKLLDRLEAARGADWVDLEDADWSLLKQKITGGLRFTSADREMLALVDAVENAQDPPA